MNIEHIKNGGWIEAHNEDNEILTPNDLYSLDMSILELSLSNMITWRDERNKSINRIEQKYIDSQNPIIIEWKQKIDKIKEAIGRQSFTDTFEACMILRVFLSDHKKRLHFFVGDADLGLILHAISLKLSSMCFDFLEKVENQHKQLFSSTFKSIE